MSYPENYKYAKSHEWLLLEGDAATIGITDYAQSSLGDIVFIELPKVGQELEAGSTFGSVESVKAVSDLYSPVTGVVTAINEALNATPDTLNAEANTTWIIKVAVKSADEASAMLSAADYEKFVAEETGH
ncbi:glycine cleavage system H protein [Bryocella elongata]|uniref:Glycine cleavage system H protein n=1 Tax=Bryocella elongata TaxID=863522 RepID=A0A1H6C9L4_9BACT|nr:glycine cleavage system protein GcvH [Bryocella elongata]SEG69660.1 glycine cleavage system H protein [Bryocella elongata]